MEMLPDHYELDGVCYTRVSRVIDSRHPFTVTPPSKAVMMEWAKKRDDGTALHAQISARFAAGDQSSSAEMCMVESFLRSRRFWRLVAQEETILSARYKIGGTIDALMYDTYQNKLVLVDWKRISKLHPCSRTRYTCQLNLYRLILEEYGIFVDEMLLVQIHPGLERAIETVVDVIDPVGYFGLDDPPGGLAIEKCSRLLDLVVS